MKSNVQGSKGAKAWRFTVQTSRRGPLDPEPSDRTLGPSARTLGPLDLWTLGPSRSAREVPRFRVHFDLLALFNKERHADHQSGFERRVLRDAAACGIAPDARLA